jgi:hypothetical protein
VIRSDDADPAEPEPATIYELEPAKISRRSSRPILLAAATIAGLLAMAIGAGHVDRGAGAPASARPVGDASTEPATVRCHDLAAGPCRRVAAAALDVIGPDASIESIDVWRSLLCGDDLDCPPSRLAGLRPLGSAVVGLGDAEQAGRVNVGERLPAGGAGSPALVAWLIH